MSEGYSYKIVSGDSLSKIAKQYGIKTWESLYNHPLNGTFKKENPDPNVIPVGKYLIIPYEISSNLVKGVPNPAGVTHPVTSLTISGWRPLFNMHMHFESNNCCPLPIQWAVVKVPLAGNVVAEKDRREVNNTAAGSLGTWAKGRFGPLGRLRTDIIAGIYWGESRNEHMPRDSVWIVDSTETAQAGALAGLSLLSTDTLASNRSFYAFAKEHYYGNNNVLEEFAVALMMDLSYGHYWGKYGMPINIPLSSEDQRFYINDFSFLNNPLVFGKVSYEIDKRPVKKGTLVPCSLSDDEVSLRTLHNNRGYLSDKVSVRVSAIGADHIKKKFTHILEPLPGNEARWCEELPKQILFTEGSVVRFPIKQFAFYHYNQRRYYTKPAELDQKCENLVNNHAFFRQSYNPESFTLGAFRELSTKEGIKKVLSHSIALMSNDNAFSRLVANGGLLWGIKMYPRLGFDPGETKTYPALKGLYYECSHKKIPITAHCSRGGMKIADYFNYSRYDRNIQAAEYNDEIAEFNFADHHTSPESWEAVLKNYPDLKLDLAHFGGYDLWHQLGEFSKLDENSTQIPNNGGVGNTAEKSGLFNKWVKKIPLMMNNYKGLFTDISYFHLKDNREIVTTNMIWMLGKYPVLKDRILLGTDWYMTEMEKMTGDGPLKMNLFTFLISISNQLKFDAWHQFTVINPMRFLGLIDESSGKMKVDTARLEKWGETIKAKAEDGDWCTKACALVSCLSRNPKKG